MSDNLAEGIGKLILRYVPRASSAKTGPLPGDRLLMRDLGVRPDDYEDLLEEVIGDFGPPSPLPQGPTGLAALLEHFRPTYAFSPRDLTIDQLVEIVRRQQWPADFVTRLR